MICEICGKRFEFGNRPDGLPNGCGFQTADGIVHDVCTDCIMGVNPTRDIKLEHIKLDTNVAEAMNRVTAIKAVQTIMEYCNSFEVSECDRCMFHTSAGCMFCTTPWEWDISEVIGNG